MPAPCPKNHYDFLKMRVPDFLGPIEKAYFGAGTADVDFDYARCAPFAKREYDRRLAAGAKGLELTVPAKVAALRMMNAPTEEIVKLQKMADEEAFLIEAHEAARIADEFERAKMFNREGRKTFYFGENLVAMLADTEMDVDCELLALPFASCMFVYEGEIVRDIFSSADVEPAGGKWVASVYLSGGNLPTNSDPAIRADCFLVTKKGYVVRKERLFSLRSGDTVEHSIAGVRTKDEKLYNEDAGELYARVVANSLLYLASSNPDIVPGIRTAADITGEVTQKQKRAIMERLTSLPYTYVGGTAKQYNRKHDGETVRVTGRKKVRGHWKSQTHGPSGSLRKIIHVEPYWRGKDTAEIVERAYRVT
ncbi:hypothetical protein OIU34_20645 [Pararhizobium sp. BT-229]|uniref:hypothetical protein n=1 Tax=Pararhizobium sp. BT-229 TaxID=2986923 RepID=UPI0021F771FF|nr:hypothetical protein [Pararhizobium sp. BT-229]MCV9964299.1 hypothetical protein [Pararhizobium sp. BT-229]